MSKELNLPGVFTDAQSMPPVLFDAHEAYLPRQSNPIHLKASRLDGTAGLTLGTTWALTAGLGTASAYSFSNGNIIAGSATGISAILSGFFTASITLQAAKQAKRPDDASIYFNPDNALIVDYRTTYADARRMETFDPDRVSLEYYATDAHSDHFLIKEGEKSITLGNFISPEKCKESFIELVSALEVYRQKEVPFTLHDWGANNSAQMSLAAAGLNAD